MLRFARNDTEREIVERGSTLAPADQNFAADRQQSAHGRESDVANGRRVAPRSLPTQILLYSVLPTVVIWLSLEAAAWLIAWLASDYWREGWRSIYQPHAYRAYAFIPGKVSPPAGNVAINEFGFRGRAVTRAKPAGTVRIACVGGSTTYGVGATTNTHTYPAIVESTLRYEYVEEPFDVEVLNCGVNAYESLQVLVYLQTVIMDFDPDIVLVHTAVNDAVLMARSARFESDYSEVKQSFARPAARWWEHSPFLSLCFRRYATIGNRYWPNEREGLLAFIWKARSIDVPSPEEARRRLDSARSWPHARNLRSIIHVVRGHGVVPVLLTMSYQPDALPVAPFVERANEHMRQLAADEDVLLLDLARLQPWSAEAFFDNCHLVDGPEGLWRKAEIVVDFLMERGLVIEAAKRLDRPPREGKTRSP